MIWEWKDGGYQTFPRRRIRWYLALDRNEPSSLAWWVLGTKIRVGAVKNLNKLRNWIIGEKCCVSIEERASLGI
jgi:hypothetical protein